MRRVLGSSRLIAILRYRDGGNLDDVIDALARGGVKNLELTIDTPGALEAVRRGVEAGLTVGVGTVISREQVLACAEMGAQFVVSPALIPEVIRAAREVRLEPIPGVLTATEIIQARTNGANLMKLFPASLGGPEYVRALRTPFPDAELVPIGGIRLDDIPDYLKAGAVAVALGKELVGRVAPRSSNEIDWVLAQAMRAVDITRAFEELPNLSESTSGDLREGPSA